jgi:hypothetical protein
VFVYEIFCSNNPKKQAQKENEGPSSPKKRDYNKKMMVDVACGWMT